MSDTQSAWARYATSKFVKRAGIAQERWVYCIGEDEPNAPVKIGTAKDVDARLAQLHRNTWRTLRVYWQVRGLPFHERELHRALSAARLRGEWFADDGGAIKALRANDIEGLIRQVLHSEVTQ